MGAEKIEKVKTDLLFTGIFEEDISPSDALKKYEKLYGKEIVQALRTGDFQGKLFQFIMLYPREKPYQRLLLMGLGSKNKFNSEVFRRACGASAREIRKAKAKTVGLDLTLLENEQLLDMAKAGVEGFLMGAYRFTTYKSKPDENNGVDRFFIFAPCEKELKKVNTQVKAGRIVAESVNLARDLANTPGNELPPLALAQIAKSQAKRLGFSCKVLGVNELKKLGMNAILAVGGGSSRPPCLVVLEYKGEGVKKSSPIVLVGKGITFDSGGISLKPPQDMERMKDDMSGAGAVLSTISAIAKMKLKVHVIGLMACAENMPGSKAYRPGDVVKTASGTTVEIISTDAEGRMVLADALHYAGNFNPSKIVDVATLTGACVIALGAEACGLMSNENALAEGLLKAGEASGERCWQLPLWEEYDELIKSDVADIKNVGGRAAGTITGGMFLKRFVKDTPWAHIDIAGTAWSEKDWAYKVKGATGAGVRLLVEFLINEE